MFGAESRIYFRYLYAQAHILTPYFRTFYGGTMVTSLARVGVNDRHLQQRNTATQQLHHQFFISVQPPESIPCCTPR
ncbi:hypothetical protein BDZ89DRAFT_1060958 [Hymenopellis radicata]|nr:hypothetical protein BDZ89DRAFT_1060958 [Hymenopellis radicata]